MRNDKVVIMLVSTGVSVFAVSLWAINLSQRRGSGQILLSSPFWEQICPAEGIYGCRRNLWLPYFSEFAAFSQIRKALRRLLTVTVKSQMSSSQTSSQFWGSEQVPTPTSERSPCSQLSGGSSEGSEATNTHADPLRPAPSHSGRPPATWWVGGLAENLPVFKVSREIQSLFNSTNLIYFC